MLPLCKDKASNLCDYLTTCSNMYMSFFISRISNQIELIGLFSSSLLSAHILRKW